MGTIEDLFAERCGDKAEAIRWHMPLLSNLALTCQVVCEFGLDRCDSSIAFLHGLRRTAGKLHSFDMQERGRWTSPVKEVVHFLTVDWNIHIGDILELERIPACDMLLLDSSHNAQQVEAELRLAEPAVKRFLVFHDWWCFGCQGQGTSYLNDDGTKAKSLRKGLDGIIPPIFKLLATGQWDVVLSETYGNGILVLERRRCLT